MLEYKCKESVKLYKEIYSEQGDKIEEEFLGMMSRLAAKPNLIGDIDRKSVIDCVPAVIEKTDKLNFHPLLASGNPLGEVELRNKIRVFPDMGKCLVEIEKSAEGLYMCYINPDESIDGYFSLIYKSNGNILSVDDQIAEAYIGQHRVQRQRNARYVESKAFEVFPYDYMFDYSKPDAKGYYTEYKLKGDFALSELPVENLFTVCLAMLLVMRKYKGKVLENKDLVYSTYLVGDESRKLLEQKALMIKKDGAVALHSQIKIELTEEDIFGYTKEHFQDSNWIVYDCHPAAVNRLISLFYDDKVKSLVPLQEDYSNLLNDTSFVENIMSKEKLVDNARYIMRIKATQAIQKNIDDYFAEHDFGNDAVRKWRELVLQRKELIFSKLTGEMFVEQKEREGVCVGYGYVYEPRYLNGIYYPFNDLKNIKFIGKSHWSRPEALCDENGQCRYIWTFRPQNWIEACLFLEIDESELPKEMIGWTRRQNDECGNPILYMTDKMERLQNGFMSFYHFYHSMCVRASEYMSELFEKKIGKIKHIHSMGDYAIYDRSNPFGFSIAMSRKTFKKVYPGAVAKVIERD